MKQLLSLGLLRPTRKDCLVHWYVSKTGPQIDLAELARLSEADPNMSGQPWTVNVTRVLDVLAFDDDELTAVLSSDQLDDVHVTALATKIVRLEAHVSLLESQLEGKKQALVEAKTEAHAQFPDHFPSPEKLG